MIPWLFHSWRHFLPTPWMELAITFTAIVAGAIIGTEREKHEKPAGLRTIILVSLGAAIYTMVSYCFPGDAGRIVAQIVTGIGFLGAGVIMRGRTTINGTTTAAAIWSTAAIGITAGAGYCCAAIGLAVLMRLLLSLVLVYETHVSRVRNLIDVEVGFAPADGKTRIKIEWILADYRVSDVHAHWVAEEEEMHRLRLRLHLARLHASQLLDDLASIPEVKSIRKECVAGGSDKAPRCPE